MYVYWVDIIQYYIKIGQTETTLTSIFEYNIHISDNNKWYYYMVVNLNRMFNIYNYIGNKWMHEYNLYILDKHQD